MTTTLATVSFSAPLADLVLGYAGLFVSELNGDLTRCVTIADEHVATLDRIACSFPLVRVCSVRHDCDARAWMTEIHARWWLQYLSIVHRLLYVRLSSSASSHAHKSVAQCSMSGAQAQREIAKLIGAAPESVTLMHEQKVVAPLAPVIMEARPMRRLGRPFSSEDCDMVTAELLSATPGSQRVVSKVSAESKRAPAEPAQQGADNAPKCADVSRLISRILNKLS